MRIKITALVLFMGIMSYLMLFRINSFNAPFERDEGAYSYIASLLRKGKMPYIDVFDHKPPLIYYTYYLAQTINSDAYWPPRLLAFISLLFTTLVFASCAIREFGNQAGSLFILVFVPMMSLPFLTPLAANTEIFMLLPFSISFLIYILKKDENRLTNFFLYGVFVALASFFKPIVILPSLFVLGVWLIRIFKKYGKISSVAVPLAWTFLGMALISFLLLLPFILKDGGASFYEDVILYNKYYVFHAPYTLHVVLLILFQNWTLLIFVIAIYLVLKPKGWWFYLGLVISSSLSLTKAITGHYFILLVPFLALIVSQTGALLMSKLDRAALFFSINLKFLRVGLYFILFLSFFIPSSSVLEQKPENINYLIYGPDQPFNASVVVAQRLFSLTQSDVKVFIAGAEPEILHYAKRESPGRFIYSYPLFVDSPFRDKFQKEVLENLELTMPEIIVFSPLYSSWFNIDGYFPSNFASHISELIDRHYVLIGGYVNDQHPGYWQEPLVEANINKASFLVYKRK